MLGILAFFAVGSAIIALGVSWQVKHISTEWWALVKYNLTISPLLFFANVLLSMGFGMGHSVIKNVPAVVALQTVIYYAFLILFSYYLVGDKISLIKATTGVALLVAGIWVLKS